MGKTKSPDFDAIIQKAVNAGRIQGSSTAKDAYKATERRLYALPVLRQKILDDREKLDEIRTHGTRERSKSIVRFSRSGYRISPEEMLEAIIRDLEATIAADEYEIECMERAIARFENDTYFETVSGRYFNEYEDADIAESLGCSGVTVWKQRNRIVQKIAVILYGSQAVR
ncbi:MAG: hypothetical protein BWY85_00267 [Firmicutes bacterium ADurb.Bin506]|nr:MAG: hypothetical protein BWY85_00267 [Firmicutes bacterium ADurb.Bin506]